MLNVCLLLPSHTNTHLFPHLHECKFVSSFFRITACCPLNHEKFAGQIIFLCVNYYQKLQRIPSLWQSLQYYFERLYRSLRQTHDCIEWFNSFINSLQAFKLIPDFSIATIFFFFLNNSQVIWLSESCFCCSPKALPNSLSFTKKQENNNSLFQVSWNFLSGDLLPWENTCTNRTRLWRAIKKNPQS